MHPKLSHARALDLKIQTERLALSPILMSDVEDYWQITRDPRLHTFVNFKPTHIDEALTRVTKWQSRSSADEIEIWLNWIARRIDTNAPVGHFQIGINLENTASVGYIVALDQQKQGYAFEAIQKMTEWTALTFGVGHFIASIDGRNQASIRLIEKLGFRKSASVRGFATVGGDTVFELRL